MLDGRARARHLLHFRPLESVRLGASFTSVSIGGRNDVTSVCLFLVLTMLVVFVKTFGFAALSATHTTLQCGRVKIHGIAKTGQGALVIRFLSRDLIRTFVSLVLTLTLARLLLPIFGQVVSGSVALRTD